MANVGFSITEDNTDKVLSETEEAIAAALEAMGQQAESYAKANIKATGLVDTGNLWNSITHQVDQGEKVVYIGTNVYYAPYLEYGTGIYADQGGRQTPWKYMDRKGVWHVTRGTKARHYLRDAVEKHKNEYKTIAESVLKNI